MEVTWHPPITEREKAAARFPSFHGCRRPVIDVVIDQRAQRWSQFEPVPNPGYLSARCPIWARHTRAHAEGRIPRALRRPTRTRRRGLTARALATRTRESGPADRRTPSGGTGTFRAMATPEVATPVEAPDPKQTAISEYGRLMLQHKVRIATSAARPRPPASVATPVRAHPWPFEIWMTFFRAREKISRRRRQLRLTVPRPVRTAFDPAGARREGS